LHIRTGRAENAGKKKIANLCVLGVSVVEIDLEGFEDDNST
jgi:hypothetical protein